MMGVKTITEATYGVAENTINDVCYVVDTASNDITVTLPLAANCTGSNVMFKFVAAANSACVSAATGDTIDGSGSLSTTTQYDQMELVSGGGTEWHLVSNGTFA